MAQGTDTKLALLGGKKEVPDGLIKKWPPIDDIDRKMVLASLNGENHAFGPNCDALQQEFAKWNGNKHAITTNSGTAALHMGIVASGCGAGDHVIVTSYTWSASATCILHHNCIPIFVDINFDTMNMDEDKIEAAITPRTKAILAVHLHGLSLNMDKICAIAKKHNLKVIEDCCQSHGALFKGNKVGTMGDCAAFSLNQNKCLCSGEGGIFVTNNDEMRNLAAQLWNFGETRTPLESRDYHAYAIGWNYRNNDMTAAFGRAQLTKLDSYLQQQRENAALLSSELKGIKGLILPTEPENHSHTYYNYTERIDMDAIGWTGDPARIRDAVLKAIVAEGVNAGVWQHYILPKMTVFMAKNAYGNGSPWAENDAMDVDYNPDNFPVAQKHADSHFGMTVPLRSPNGEECVRAVARAIRKVFDNLEAIDPEKVLAQ